MQSKFKDQEGSIHVFGEKWKAANWIVSHVFLVVGGILLFLCLLTALAGELKLWRVLMIVPYLFGPAIFFRLLLYDRCYRVEVDTATERIRFFRFFHKEIIEAPVHSVTFRFTWKMNGIYGGTKVSITHEDMVQIAELLPWIEIEFSEGLLGRLAKKQFGKSRQANRDRK